jgi:hypothetical protein
MSAECESNQTERVEPALRPLRSLLRQVLVRPDYARERQEVR